MPNYCDTQLYELIESDENGAPVIYRGHTTQPLHKRLAEHRRHFKLWKEGKIRNYYSSYEVLKHGPARIEFVRAAPCFTKKEANREEGKFIRELPTCVNIQKNYETNKEHYQANIESIKKQRAQHYQENKEVKHTMNIEYYKKNKQRIKTKVSEYRNANKDKRNARDKANVTCECGAVVRRDYISRHRNTSAHIHSFIFI